MEKDEIVKLLVKNDRFRERVAEYFHLTESGDFSVSDLERGGSKLAFKVKHQPTSTEFVVKEIRFGGRMGRSSEDPNMDQNVTLLPKEAFYELSTIREIARNRSERQYFPKHIATFAYVHPEYDSYTGDVLEAGKFVSLQQAKKMQEETRGISLFIAEELVKGRLPNQNEVVQAQQIRRDGMERCPRIWLTVDTGRYDIIVRDDGFLTFIDVGNFREYLTPQEEQMLKEFMAEGRKK